MMLKYLSKVLLIILLASCGLKAQKNDVNMKVITKRPKFINENYNNFNHYIENNYNVPKKAFKDSIEGKILIKFTIDTTGKIVNPRIIEGIGGGCDSALIYVLKKSPEWKPGSLNGIKVKMEAVVPVVLDLPEPRDQKEKESMNKMHIHSFYDHKRVLRYDE